MARAYIKDTKVGFWDYDNGKFTWVTGVITNRINTESTKYKIKGDDGKTYFKFHSKLSLLLT